MGGTVKTVDVETVFEAQDRLHVVYPKGHRIARLKTITPGSLAEFPLILTQRDTSVRAIVDAGFHSAGLMPRATCEAIYMMTAVGMVRAGLGLTILPGSAREIRAEPGLQSKPIDDPRFTRPVSIIKRSGRTLPPLTASFLEYFSVCLGTVSARSPAAIFPRSPCSRRSGERTARLESPCATSSAERPQRRASRRHLANKPVRPIGRAFRTLFARFLECVQENRYWHPPQGVARAPRTFERRDSSRHLYSHVLLGMQEDAAAKVDAAIRTAIEGN
jgi:hypothetical protein